MTWTIPEIAPPPDAEQIRFVMAAALRWTPEPPNHWSPPACIENQATIWFSDEFEITYGKRPHGKTTALFVKRVRELAAMAL